jgi:formyl-CoA transferase
MLERADVFVQNLRPGAVDRMGFDAATLAALNPMLIRCDIAGFPSDSPMATRGAYDLLIQAESGLAGITGAPEAPGRVGVSIVDIATGLNAHAAILEALIARGRTGRGGVIETTLFGVAAELMAVPLIHQDYAGRAPTRVGLAHPSVAPYGLFRAADGGEVVIGVQNPREWRAFCEIVMCDAAMADDPRFAVNADRIENRAALDAAIAHVAGGLTRADLLARLAEADVPCAPLSSVADLSDHPALRRITVEAAGGALSIPAPGATRGDAARDYGRVPALGEHTAAIMAEFAAD